MFENLTLEKMLMRNVLVTIKAMHKNIRHKLPITYELREYSFIDSSILKLYR